MDTLVASTFWLLWIGLLWTSVYECLFKMLSSVLQDVYPEIRLLDHKVILFLTLWGIPTLFSKAAAPFCIPLNSAQAFLFLHILTNTFSNFFGSSHRDGYEVIWQFWFALPWMISDVECLFGCFLVLMIYVGDFWHRICHHYMKHNQRCWEEFSFCVSSFCFGNVFNMTLTWNRLYDWPISKWERRLVWVPPQALKPQGVRLWGELIRRFEVTL